jgi:uncharacterized protein with NRDE domain
LVTGRIDTDIPAGLAGGVLVARFLSEGTTMATRFAEALKRVPACVECDDVADGDMDHLIYRVEHVVDIRQDEGSESIYSAAEARACRNWLKRFAPRSEYV